MSGLLGRLAARRWRPPPARGARPAGPRRSSLVARGLAYLGVVAALIGLMCAQFVGSFEDYLKVRANLTGAGDALVRGSDVKMRGVVVGRVGTIRRGEGPNDMGGTQASEGLTSVLGTRGAIVELLLFKSHAANIPATVTARSLPANFFGQAFVDLVPTAEGADATVEPLAEAVVARRDRAEEFMIRQDNSLETAQLQEVFDKLYRVVTAIQPAKLQAALGALAEALSGRGTKVNALIAHTDAYLRELAPGLPALQHDIGAFADFAETLDAQGPRLLDSVDDLLVTARTVVERQQQLVALLSGGLRLTRNASGVVSDNERRAVTVARQGRQIIGALSQYPRAFSDGFVDLGAFLGGLSTRDNGRIGLDTLIGSAPLRPYTKDDCPRYPGLKGPNCPYRDVGEPIGSVGVRAPAPPPPVGPVYGGTVGPVGSLAEKLSLAAVLAAIGTTAGVSYGDVGILMAGSLLRGSSTVVLP